MPNGFYGSKAEWERLAGPLREIDVDVNRFASAYGMEVLENYHNTPNRMLLRTVGGITRMIQIELYGDRLIMVSFAAWSDKAGERHGTRWPVQMGIRFDRFKMEIMSYLEPAREELERVTEADLKFWTRLSTP